ncbi:hypothetical protein D3C75_912890 [compost metagenome]
MIAELLIILRGEEPVFAPGIHPLQGFRGTEFIRRTYEVDVYLRRVMLDDIELLHQIVLFTVRGKAVLFLAQNRRDIQWLLQHVADMLVAEHRTDAYRHNAPGNPMAQSY